MAIQDRIFGHVDRLGYLRCAACADASDVTHAKDRPVTCAPHSEEPCDKCGRRLDAPPVDPAISAAAATLGRKGGQANTPAQFRARSRNAAINGKKGGRPLGSKSAQHGPYRIVIRHNDGGGAEYSETSRVRARALARGECEQGYRDGTSVDVISSAGVTLARWRNVGGEAIAID